MADNLTLQLVIRAVVDQAKAAIAQVTDAQVKLTAATAQTNTTAETGATAAKAQTAALDAQGAAAKRTAAEISRLNETYRLQTEAMRHPGVSTQTATAAPLASLSGLYNKIDPAAAKLDKLDQLEAQLLALQKTGSVTDDVFEHLSQKLISSRAAITAVGEGAHGAAAGFNVMSLASGQAAREYGVLAGELARGNFTRFNGSLLTLSNRVGLLPMLFSPVGAAVAGVTAAVAVLTAAFAAGEREDSRFGAALISTHNYAGETLGGLRDLAQQLTSTTGATIGSATQVTTALAASGKFTRDQLALVGQGALDMATVTGEGVDKTIGVFEKLQESPVKTLMALNEQYHFLTPAVLEHVQALEEEGRAREAATVATEAYASSMRQSAASITENLGSLQRVWGFVKYEASAAWEAMLGIGKEETLQDKLGALKDRLDYLNDHPATLQTPAMIDQERATLTAQIAALKQQIAAQDAAAAKKATDAQDNTAADKAIVDLHARAKALGLASDKQAELTQLTQEYLALEKKAPDDPLLKGVSFANGQPSGGAYDLFRAQIESKGTGNGLSGLSATIDAQLSVVRAKLSAAQAQLKQQLNAGQIDYTAYFAALTTAETTAIDKQIALRQQELAKAQAAVAKLGAGTPASQAAQGQVQRIGGEIDALRTQRQQQLDAIGAERLEQEKKTDAQLVSMRVELFRAQGDEADAQLLALTQKYQQWIADLKKAGNTAGVALAQELFSTEQSKIQLDAIQEQAQAIVERLRTQKTTLANEVRIGSITPEQAQIAAQLDRKTAGTQLDALSRKVGDTQGVDTTKAQGVIAQAKASLDGLNVALSQTQKTITGGLLSGMQNFFSGIISGASSAKEAFRGLISSIGDMFTQLAAKLLAMTVLKGILNGLAGAFGGGGSSIGSALGSMASSIKMASGGHVAGAGTATSDSIPAMLSNGEYVLNAKTVRSVGVQFLDALNGGTMPRVSHFATGGYVGNSSPANLRTGGHSTTVNVPVSVTVSGGDDSDPETAQRHGKQLGLAIKAAIQRELVNQQRPGGLLAGAH